MGGVPEYFNPGPLWGAVIRILVRCESDGGLIANVDIGMDMGFTAEKDERRRPLDLPNIPDAIVPEIAILVKGHVEMVELSRVNHLEGLIGVFFAERSEDVAKDLADMILLVARECLDGDSREIARFPGQGDRRRAVF